MHWKLQMDVASTNGRPGALYDLPNPTVTDFDRQPRMRSPLWECSEELISWTKLEQKHPRVDTLRRVRRTVLHHLPHPPHGRKLSAEKHIFLLIHPGEDTKEQWLQDPHYVGLVKKPSFLLHTRVHWGILNIYVVCVWQREDLLLVVVQS
jgi:hypothetical protein